MDRQAKIDFILEHYEDPRHYGPTHPADVVLQGGNPGCGDIVTVYLKSDEHDHVSALSFEGETAPYVQYTCARTTSVLEKAPALDGDIDYAQLCDEEAGEVVRMLEAFPAKIIEAAERCEPYLVARHIVNLAQAFNRFYYEHRIIGEDAARMRARLALVSAVRSCLKRGLWLLGIEAPEHM